MPYPCWRGLNDCFYFSAAKVHKSLDITKHFVDFNTNLTLVGQNMAKQEGECSRIPLTFILTYNFKPIN